MRGLPPKVTFALEFRGSQLLTLGRLGMNAGDVDDLAALSQIVVVMRISLAPQLPSVPQIPSQIEGKAFVPGD